MRYNQRRRNSPYRNREWMLKRDSFGRRLYWIEGMGPKPGCSWCHRPLKDKRSDAIYCSPACKQAGYRAMRGRRLANRGNKR